jgi:hypothetical protein
VGKEKVEEGWEEEEKGRIKNIRRRRKSGKRAETREEEKERGETKEGRRRKR